MAFVLLLPCSQAKEEFMLHSDTKDWDFYKSHFFVKVPSRRKIVEGSLRGSQYFGMWVVLNVDVITCQQ